MASTTSTAFQEWLAKQTEIFGRFGEQSPFQHGTVVDGGSNPQSGLLVHFNLPRFVARPLADLSSVIEQLVPRTIMYGVGTLHVSVGDFGLAPDSERPIHHVDWGAQSALWKETEQLVVPAVAKAIEGLSPATLADATMRYTKLLANRGSVIAASDPSEALFDLRTAIVTAVQAAGINLRGGWGAHTTLNRFRAEYAADSPEIAELGRLFDMVDVPADEFAVTSVAVSILSVDGRTFRLHPLYTTGW